MFTRQQIEEIRDKLLLYSKKDSQLESALSPITGKEEVVLVQNGKNVKITILDLINNIFPFKSLGFINISNAIEHKFTLEEAISAILPPNRKSGLVITFFDKNLNTWVIYQYRGVYVRDWLNLELWEELFDGNSKFKGYILNECLLNTIYPAPRIGDYAFVGPSLGEAVVARCINNGVWSITTEAAKDYVKIIIDGNITVGENGNWVQNGVDTGIKAQGPAGEKGDSIKGDKGDTPIIRFNESTNFIQYGYDGKEWIDLVNTEEFNVTNFPDDEDIIEKENKLKFADKEYNNTQFSGLGRKYLRKNIINGKNILTQEMINVPNTIYNIQYDFDLNGAEITIPEGCILKFEGGSLNNGTVTFNKTYLDGNPYVKTRIKGYLINDVIHSSWFNVYGNGVDDDRENIQNIINSCIEGKKVIIDKSSSYYKIVNGYGNGESLIEQRADAIKNSTLYPITVDKNDITIEIRGILKSTSILGDLIVINGNNVIIEGCGKIQGVGGNDDEGFLDTNSDDVTKQWKPSLLVTNGENITVRNISFEDGPTTCINSCNIGAHISNCIFIGGRVVHNSTTLFGIMLNNNSLDSIVKNNRFMPNTKNGKYCSCVYCLTHRANIESNTFAVYHEHGIYSYGQEIIIVSNIFKEENSLASDIQFFNKSYIVSNNIAINTKEFLQTSRCENTIISSNVILGTNNGIAIRSYYTGENKLDNIKIIDNTIVLRESPSDGFCISIDTNDAESNNCIIKGNTLDGGSFNLTTLRSPLVLRGIRHGIISNNIIQNAERTNFLLYRINECVFSNNIFIGSGLEFGRVNNINSIFFKDNMFVNNSESKVYILICDAASNNIFYTNNSFKNIAGVFNSNLPKNYCVVDNIINFKPFHGTTVDRPSSLFKENMSQKYYDTDIRKSITWDGNKRMWMDNNGIRIDTRTEGTFAQKPTVANNFIPTGFAYFCTDKQTSEGSTNGIMIYHKGDNIWVDSLGRTIS